MDYDQCPLPLQSNSLNVKNHLYVIEEHGLGPGDPTQTNDEFWADKGKKWNCSANDARGRLCMNCRYYVNATIIKDCIDHFPVKDLKASALPVTPKWKDMESKPQAYCVLFDITCSPVRTCDNQLMGGPVDDDKMELPQFKDILTQDKEEE